MKIDRWLAPSNQGISFVNNFTINARVFVEEFFHAYQDLFYGTLPPQALYLGRSNIEFEAKLYHDIVHPNCCIAFWDGPIRQSTKTGFVK